MTNNFEKILGKGGFGIVYYGSVNGTEKVAVKMLSHSSAQGYKQFKAEVNIPKPLMELGMIIHDSAIFIKFRSFLQE